MDADRAMTVRSSRRTQIVRNSSLWRCARTWCLSASRRQRLPMAKIYALLFDADTGELLSFMGFPFGTVRTAAVVAIAAKHLARQDSQRLGLFGVGRNAFGILQGMLSVRPIKEIVVSSRDPQRRKKFCEEG